MSENHNIGLLTRDEALDLLTQVARVYNMMQEDFSSAKSYNLGLRIIKTWIISVAANACHSGNGFQFRNDFWQTNIARMEDMLHALKQIMYSSIKEVMSVRNDADFEHDQIK